MPAPYQYEEIEELRQDGVVIVITRRVSSGHLSFRIQKEFESRGEVKATSYLSVRHVDAIIQLTKLAKDRIDILTDEFKIARARGQ